MSTEHNKQLVIGYIHSLNQKKVDLEEFLDPGFVLHNPLQPGVNHFASARQYLADSLVSFPDQLSTIEDLVAEGDKVVCRYSVRATHKRDFRGLPATGKQITFRGIAIYRISGEKIQEEWFVSLPGSDDGVW